MASAGAKKPKRSLARPFVVTVAAVGLPSAVVVAGCGTDKPDGSGGNTVGSSSGNPGTGADSCATDGEKRACHLSVGSNHGFQSCFYGSQVCLNGSWSSCSDSPDGTIVNSLPGLQGQALAGHGADLMHIATFTDAGTGVPVCTSDPCDPGCTGWNQNTVPPVTPVGTGVGVQGFGQIPGGQLNKLLDDNCNSGSGNCNTQNPPGSLWQCQMDTYCDMAGGCCVQHPALDIYGVTPAIVYGGSSATGAYPPVAPLKPNLTMGPGCNFSDKQPYDYFPICNRGNAPAIPPSGKISTSVMNPQGSVPTTAGDPCNARVPGSGVAYYPTTCLTDLTSATVLNRCPATTPGCQITAGQIDPGNCVLMKMSSDCVGGNPSGEKWMFVNADNTVDEGLFGYDTIAYPGQTTPIKGCADNWSDHTNNNNPPSCFGTTGVVQFTNEYYAKCPPGYAPQWEKLTWDTTQLVSNSNSTEVLFEAATAPEISPGVAGTYGNFYEIGEAQQDCDWADPEKCQMNGSFNGSLQACDPGFGGNKKIVACSNEFANGNINNGNSPPCCPKDFLDQFSRPNPLPGTATGSFTGVGLPDTLTPKQYAQQPFMRLRVTLKTTPDGKATPTLNSWSLSYVCVGSE